MTHSIRATVTRITPPGTGGVAVVQLVGPDAESILHQVLARRPGPPGTLIYTCVVNRAGETVDEVIVDTVEPDQYAINGHGGEAASRAILHLLVEHGAHENTAAQDPVPDGPRDLVQQTAWALLPQATTRRTVAMLLDQVNGALSDMLRHADVDVLDRLLLGAEAGIRLVDPPRVVLIGKPNVGKSSLANALHRSDRSIVTELAGTTLDPVEELAVINGWPIRLIDTAGTASTDVHLERLANAAAQQEMERAELLVHLVDGSKSDAPEPPTGYEAPIISVVNKCDGLSSGAGVEANVINTSCITGEGLDALRERLVAVLFPGLPKEPGGAVLFTRSLKDGIISARTAWADGHAEKGHKILTTLLDGTA